ncbi:plasmid replication initiator protein RepA [Jannaschia pagri]|uniref:Plasmid replication initiator protein RepA n=2 Tax=Roseobacteraceae TaxID=2854170 RepID=A0ABQ4NS56_9RHOB|nr:plasmid replication initiator protein RepA [Jannaschia sp. AI_61]GIT97125.1 plasmid replication initiator protein RepA [Jannaschia sp. AI_62]
MFVCDIVDAVPKGDMSSMEHPVFSLATKPDMRPRRYESGDSWIEVQPSQHGLATVHDRDVLIYCISQCMSAINDGRKVSRRMRFKAYDLLVATNRQTSGRGYDLLKDALRRLQGTQIETNIRQGGREYFKVFGLIDSAEIVRETRDGRMLDVEIALSDWVFDAIENNHVLTLNRRYFMLRKPLERRLYELARKHCGHQPRWPIGLEKLREKCGSGSTPKEFRRLIGKILEDDAAHDYMPDYAFKLDADKVVVTPKRVAQQTDLPFETPALRLSADVHEKARTHAPGWDVHALEGEWRSWVMKKSIEVKDADSHFLSFCKRRGAYRFT